MTKAEQFSIEQALKACPDVRPSEVVYLILMRQSELEQEPDEHE